MTAALPHTLAAAALVLTAITSSCSTSGNRSGTARHPSHDPFRHSVKPLIEGRCVWCHNDAKPAAGLNFQKPRTVLAESSRFVVPGKPEQSRLYIAVIRPNTHPRGMPGDGWGITAEQKAMLGLWIEQGAVWPEGRAGKIRQKRYRVEFDDYL